MHDSVVIPERGLRKVADNIGRYDEMKSNPFVNVVQGATSEPELRINPLRSFIGEP